LNKSRIKSRHQEQKHQIIIIFIKINCLNKPKNDDKQGVGVTNQISIKMKSVFKNIIVLMCFASFWGTGYAQDIIVTKDSKRIDAKVLEVNISEVKYKNFSNQDGPTYTILKSGIASIVYENGTVETFTGQVPAAASANSSAVVVSASLMEFDRMSDDEQEKFLERTDREIHEKFHRGSNLRKAGSGLLSSGLGLGGGGLTLMIVGLAVVLDDYTDYTTVATALTVCGEVLFGIGQALVVASIPLSAVGGATKNSAQNDYKRKYFGVGYTPSVRLNVYGTGVGLAVHF
jgi:hypothetical protein